MSAAIIQRQAEHVRSLQLCRALARRNAKTQAPTPSKAANGTPDETNKRRLLPLLGSISSANEKAAPNSNSGALSPHQLVVAGRKTLRAFISCNPKVLLPGFTHLAYHFNEIKAKFQTVPANLTRFDRAA